MPVCNASVLRSMAVDGHLCYFARMNMARLLAIALVPMALGSCSYAIDLRAVAVDGKLAFVSTTNDFDCIANIYVMAEGDIVADVDKGDDVGLVTNGQAFWWTSNPTNECETPFPILYGEAKSSVPNAVKPKRLRFDVVYQVQTQGQGAYGSGRFRVHRDGRIENLLSTPPPPDAAGKLKAGTLNSS